MTQEKQLISELRKLRDIEPRKDWVSLTKLRLLEQEPKTMAFPYFKLAFSGVLAILIFVGLFAGVKASLPGDPLYTLKRAYHKAEAVFVFKQDDPTFQLKLANKTLNDLAKAPAKNLAPTINEFQANISEAAKQIAKLDVATSSPALIRQIVQETKKIGENKQKMEQLGIYEVLEEDFALCDYVCTSKQETQDILRQGLDLMIKEVG